MPALANAVVMVRPDNIGANPETLGSNAFQIATTEQYAAERALQEQAALASALENVGVRVVLLEPPSRSPDAVFPNNWFSTHVDGRIVLYPMQARSRRTERVPDLGERLASEGFVVGNTFDLSVYENEGRFLEGTGSLVLDRDSRIAYACPSIRTDRELAQEWADEFGYELCWFEASGPDGRPVYHTNVIMSVGAGVAIICLESVTHAADRERLVAQLQETGKQIIDISWMQVEAFAGNQLFLQGAEGPVLALSSRAEAALRAEQKLVLDQYARRVSADIATIERHGGGSVRCMLAEIFLPTR